MSITKRDDLLVVKDPPQSELVQSITSNGAVRSLLRPLVAFVPLVFLLAF